MTFVYSQLQFPEFDADRVAKTISVFGTTQTFPVASPQQICARAGEWWRVGQGVFLSRLSLTGHGRFRGKRFAPNFYGVGLW